MGFQLPQALVHRSRLVVDSKIHALLQKSGHRNSLGAGLSELHARVREAQSLRVEPTDASHLVSAIKMRR